MRSQSPYPTWVEINLDAIAENTRAILSRIKTPLMAVVKCDAYGMGAVQTGRAALEAGASWLAVARYCEARALRKAGITAPILVFEMVTPFEVEEAISEQVTLTMYSQESAAMFSECAKKVGQPVQVHMKIDTGLGRLGVFPDEAVALARYALSLGGIDLTGTFSHLSMVEDVPDHPLTDVQMQRFSAATEAMTEAGISPGIRHLANSAALLVFQQAAFDMVRAGVYVLGIKPLDFQPFPPDMRRAMTWKAQLASCKIVPKGWGISYGQDYITQSEELIGVIAAGYGDGFRRIPGNEVLIGGQRVPVVGRVCIDQCMVRLPCQYPLGEEVILMGCQGNEEITQEELAHRWRLGEAEVSTQINFRVPRVYIQD